MNKKCDATDEAYQDYLESYTESWFVNQDIPENPFAEWEAFDHDDILLE